MLQSHCTAFWIANSESETYITSCVPGTTKVVIYSYRKRQYRQQWFSAIVVSTASRESSNYLGFGTATIYTFWLIGQVYLNLWMLCYMRNMEILDLQLALFGLSDSTIDLTASLSLERLGFSLFILLRYFRHSQC